MAAEGVLAPEDVQKLQFADGAALLAAGSHYLGCEVNQVAQGDLDLARGQHNAQCHEGEQHSSIPAPRVQNVVPSGPQHPIAREERLEVLGGGGGRHFRRVNFLKIGR